MCRRNRAKPNNHRIFVSVNNEEDTVVFMEVSLLKRLSSHYQSLFLSYPSLINRSPATSLKILLCSSVKYFFHSPVFPERNVGERFGLIDDSRHSRTNALGA